jgi:hypothetical protein
MSAIEHPTADELPTPFYNRADHTWELTPDQWRKVCELVIDLRRSLRREENARKVLAETNQRLIAEIKALGGGFTKTVTVEHELKDWVRS